jgi:polyhydroxyalkanoate depolymerase
MQTQGAPDMPQSVISLFPYAQLAIEAAKLPLKATSDFARFNAVSMEIWFEMLQQSHSNTNRILNNLGTSFYPTSTQSLQAILYHSQESLEDFARMLQKNTLESFRRFTQNRQGELEFLDLFSRTTSQQDWETEYDDANVLLDLPSLRLIDISLEVEHSISNYAVVFAPRAGHHSNIAERVALYLRDHGLSRMAIVEQKCAADIPLHINGQRHSENFDGQVNQYLEVLNHLQELSGAPSHLIAICQPGPLLLSSLILQPGLGRTFGSAGSPMHTTAATGPLTDFARLMGEQYIDLLTSIWSQTIEEDCPGAGRQAYDGRLQVLGFYLLGLDTHLRNFKRLLNDLRQGEEGSAERQKIFYDWYNFVHHMPLEFIRDTYKKIFVNNELITGRLAIGSRTVSIADYPAEIPVWALGGTRDEIAPLGQAVGHMDLLSHVPDQDRLTVRCEAGHMGLFRSKRVLANHYSQVIDFLLHRSDPAAG